MGKVYKIITKDEKPSCIVHCTGCETTWWGSESSSGILKCPHMKKGVILKFLEDDARIEELGAQKTDKIEDKDIVKKALNFITAMAFEGIDAPWLEEIVHDRVEGQIRVTISYQPCRGGKPVNPFNTRDGRVSKKVTLDAKTGDVVEMRSVEN